MIYFDIETTANDKMIQFLPEPKAPGNYKSLAKIAEWTDKAKQKQIAKAALDLDAARIISIAAAKDDDKPVGWALPIDERQDRSAELALLCEFWDFITPPSLRRFAGYNIRNFDLPILLRRTWQHGLTQSVNVLPLLNRASGRVIDLMELLYHQGYTSTRYRGLKDVCQMYGIRNPLPDVDGSMVDGLSASELLAYNINDVELARELARRTEGYYWFGE